MNDSEQILDEILKDLCMEIAQDVRRNHPNYDWCQRHRLEARTAVLQHYISKEEVERAMPPEQPEDGEHDYASGLQEGFNLAVSETRKNLGLDDK